MPIILPSKYHAHSLHMPGQHHPPSNKTKVNKDLVLSLKKQDFYVILITTGMQNPSQKTTVDNAYNVPKKVIVLGCVST